MAFVSLPAIPRLAKISPKLIRFGGDLTSAMGGPTQRLARLGSRFAITVGLPTMDLRCAETWIAARLQAEAEGSTLRLTLSQAAASAVTGRTAAAGAVGTSLPISSSAGISAGWWVSYLTGGRSYLHKVTAITSGAEIAVAPLLRAPPAAATALEFVAPVAEGFVDDIAWDLDLLRFVGQSFTLTEDR